MTHYTAEIPFYLSYYRDSFVLSGRKNGIYIEEIHLVRNVKLTAIIHEINECELTHLLEDKFAKDYNGIEFIEITTKILRKIKERFGSEVIFKKKGDEVLITHMISPYGHDNCFMPRRKYRAIW